VTGRGNLILPRRCHEGRFDLISCTLCMDTDQSEQKYVTTYQLATRLQLHPRTLSRAVDRGELIAVRVGRLVRFTEVDIERWLGRSAAPRRAGGAPPIVAVTSVGPRRRIGGQMPLIGPPRRRG
jgi:excisionase family DNA binding protein